MSTYEKFLIRPFLRWAGGKRWLTKHVDTIVSHFTFNNYHEPFLGSGAIYLHLKPTNKSFLSDVNTELIDTYSCIKHDVERVIVELQKFRNTKEEYYKVRSSTFKSEFKAAARFIYLNQTSFNGIYRVNLKGEYNVPYGFRQKNFCEPENLRLVQEVLKKTTLQARDFEVVKKNLKCNDLVFLDPPYTVTHNYNGFIKYNHKLFSLDDQYRLSQLIDFIKSKQAYYILTNAAHKRVEQIFEKGDKKVKLKRASVIGGLNSKRGHYEEIVFTNIV